MLLFISFLYQLLIYHKFISIHLMLLFIGLFHQLLLANRLFQYISCYCLSEFDTSQKCCDKNFNTSHVTVYLLPQLFRLLTVLISIHLMLLFIQPPICILLCKSSFQYISCYCLSSWRPVHSFSHEISIHLMLLFICFRHLFFHASGKFQYISCYCLSLSIPDTASNGIISIHLMLLFIGHLLPKHWLHP